MLLKEERVKAELNQLDVARKLGVPQSFVSKYESGERTLDLLEVRAICQVIGIRLPNLINKLEDKLDSK